MFRTFRMFKIIVKGLRAWHFGHLVARQGSASEAGSRDDLGTSPSINKRRTTKPEIQHVEP